MVTVTYYNSFYTFIETCESYLESARVGEPIDIGIQQTKEGNSSGKIILLLIPLIIALVTASVQKGKMKTAKIQQKAREYVTKEGLKLTGREDVFLYKNVVKTKRESDSDSGGTSVDSRGSSHSSGKF